MFYAYVNVADNQILGSGECPRKDETTISLEISEEIYNNIERYKYDGLELILDPDYEQRQAQEERERISKLSLTKREVFLALYKAKGITPEQIRSQLLSPEALIEFDYASEYFRGNPLIDVIGQSLGFSAEQLDYLFVHRELPIPDNEGV